MLRAIISTVITAGIFFGCGSPKKTVSEQTPRPEDTIILPPGVVTDTFLPGTLPAKLFLVLQVQGFGRLKVELYPQDAPLNVRNVANLAIKGFYNGLTFHRIEPGFVVQGGDPKGDGTGGPGYTVPAEIKRRHEKGAMAMARLPDEVNPRRESSGSQFYFCLNPLPQLDGKYTVIGRIVEGMDVLEKIGQSRPPVNIDWMVVTTE
ncbi:MAG: peptidylprolyl isomerase [candidate division WOR-3 bacterium]